jgi:hypothetical protein
MNLVRKLKFFGKSVIERSALDRDWTLGWLSIQGDTDWIQRHPARLTAPIY